jgi:hypothetical protein
MTDNVHSNGGATGGITGKGFQPGQSGNPGGRKPGLARRVRELVGDDGSMVAEMMLTIARGEPYAGLEPSLRDVMDAGRWLADRGWGQATQKVAGDDEFGAVLLDRPAKVTKEEITAGLLEIGLVVRPELAAGVDGASILPPVAGEGDVVLPWPVLEEGNER